MTDEEFDIQVEAISHVLRLGHIVESRLGGHVDEKSLADALSGVRNDADERRRNLERERETNERTIADLKARLAETERERDDARVRLSRVADLLDGTGDGADGADGNEAPTTVATAEGGNEDQGTYEHDGTVYTIVEDPSTLPRVPGHARPILVDGTAFYPSANQMAADLMPAGGNHKSEATSANKALRNGTPWHGHTLRYLSEAG